MLGQWEYAESIHQIMTLSPQGRDKIISAGSGDSLVMKAVHLSANIPRPRTDLADRLPCFFYHTMSKRPDTHLYTVI